MERGRVEIESPFEHLPDDYASLGQNQSYYENLIALEETDRLSILSALRDTIWDANRFAEFRNENAFQTSLLRSISQRELRKFRAIIFEQATLTPFHFMYTFPGSEDARVEVEVTPGVVPPTNIHVIIGRNGVGKTLLLRTISRLGRDSRVWPG